MSADNRLGLVPPSQGDFLMPERVQQEVVAGRKSRLNTPLAGWKKGVLGVLTFATSALGIACAAPATTEAKATVTAIPGIGGSEPFATVAPDYPNAKELNDIIKRLNDPSTAGSVSQEDKNKVTLVISIPAQGTATAEAAKLPSKETPTPTVSAVEQAIKAGKIDIKTPAEAAQIFTPVSQSEAVTLEAKAREINDGAMFLPVKNVEKHTNFQVNNFVISGRRGDIPAVGISGIISGDSITTLESGKARIIMPGKTESSSFYTIEINTGKDIIQIYYKDPDAQTLIETGASKETDVKPGDDLLTAGSPGKLPEVYKGYQIVITKRQGDVFQPVTLEDFIKAGNKFASIN